MSDKHKVMTGQQVEAQILDGDLLDPVNDNGVPSRMPLENLHHSDKGYHTPAVPVPRSRDFSYMLDVPMTMSFEVDCMEISIRKLMELRQGSVLDLLNKSVDVIRVNVNGCLIAEGEALALNQRYGIRINEFEKFKGE